MSEHFELRSTAAASREVAGWRVWDTYYAAPSTKFQLYREGACDSFMPLSPEWSGDDEFSARIETLSIGSGALTRVETTPHPVLRTPRDLVKVDPNYVHLNIVLSGGALLEQGGREQSLRVGDIILFDTARAFKMRQFGKRSHQIASLLICKRDLDIGSTREDAICNRRVSDGPVGAALRAVMCGLVAGAAELRPSEFESLYEACIALCSVAAGLVERDVPGASASPLYQECLRLIDEHLAAPDLSAEKLAGYLGVSARYIHKVFARAGSSVGKHILDSRLRCVRTDLASPSMRHVPVSSIVFRWGFNDLSAFNRRFKRRYGITPSQLRKGMP